MKVIGYIRVSTTEQDQSGLGLADQEAKIRAYCDLYNLSLVEIKKDAASGKNMERPGLQNALALLKSGQVEGIIVAKLDRLTRSVRDMGILLDKYFQKNGLFVVAEQIDTRTAAGRLLLNLLTSVAQWERETIGERTAAALSVKKRNGERVGTIPYGYDCDANGKLTANEKEQETIARIKALRASGYSFEAIARQLNSDGILTKLGKQWSKASVFKIYNKAA